MRRLLVLIPLMLLAIGWAGFTYADDIIDSRQPAGQPVAATPAPAPEPTSPPESVPPNNDPAPQSKPDKPSDKTEKKPPAVSPAQPGDNLILVNKEHQLPANYVPTDLTRPDMPFSFTGGLPKGYLRQEAAAALSRLYRQAVSENISIVGVSGYRSYQTQQEIFNRKAAALGENVANQSSARPGQSEHQTGLAIDISSPSVGNQLTQSFGQTREGVWLAQNAPRYGFIIRYPKGKESITGYIYEPWHLRYVGIEAAQAISSRHITLEEYLK